MLLIFFLKVDIEHTFVFPKIMLHTGEKCHVQRQSSFWQKVSSTKTS